MSIDIPLKPKNDDEFTTLRKGDKECIVYAVLCGVDNQTAFLRYNPHFAISVGKTTPKFALSEEGKKQNRNFWSYPKNRAYREAYEATLAEFLGRKFAPKSEVVEVDGDRRDKALKSLLSQAMSLVEGGADLDADSLKVVTDIFSKLGFIKGEEEQQEKPRRYLPQRCSLCDYRSFVESYVETGEIENTCLRCKALTIATEHGFHYDPKDLLRPNDEKTAE